MWGATLIVHTNGGGSHFTTLPKQGFVREQHAGIAEIGGREDCASTRFRFSGEGLNGTVRNGRMKGPALLLTWWTASDPRCYGRPPPVDAEPQPVWAAAERAGELRAFDPFFAAVF